MKTLEVSLDYVSSDLAMRSPKSLELGASTPFPFRVVDAHGGALAEGAVNSRQSTRVEFDDPLNNDVLFVRLVWPTGRATTQMVDYSGSQGAAVNFTDEMVGEDAWAKWAAPRVPYARVPMSSSRSEGRVDRGDAVDRFGNVWLRLWTHTASGWALVDGMPRSSSESNAKARQMDLQLGPGSHLLQVGGAQMPWVFVSLPGNGPCRVYLTPNPAADAMNLPLKLVVTSFRPEAETLVEFLSRDALRAADSIGRFGPVAMKLLQGKVEDAVSAIAGAYYLLRVGRWRETPIEWFDNLYNWFPWSADAALIRCVVTLRKGLNTQDDTLRALEQLRQSVDRGVPLFEEAHRVQVEAHTLLRGLLFPSSAEADSSDRYLAPAQPDKFKPLIDKCQAFAAARAWTGPSFSYFGGVPDQPSSQKTRGAPPSLSCMGSGDTGQTMISLSDVLLTETSTPAARDRRPTPRRRKRQPSVTYLKDL